MKNVKPKAAVGVVYFGNKWLLGLGVSEDDRNNRWCFPGGSIESGESPEEAAVREVLEETGVKCKAMKGHFYHDKNEPDVVFVLCKASGMTTKGSDEMPVSLFATRLQMRSLRLFPNVVDILNKVK